MEPEEVESKRPKDTNFRQQRLKSCQPILTPLVVVSIFLGVGVLMFTLGFIMWHYDGQVVEVVQRYDDQCTPPAQTEPPYLDNHCFVTIEVPEEIPAPVFMYYRLTNFYQNHRRYVSSRADAQLAGEVSEKTSGLSACTPLIAANDTFDYTTAFNPCGLVASSWFIDEFDQFENTDTGDAVMWDRQNIAWQSDVDQKFKRIPLEQLQANPDLKGTTPPNLVQFTDPNSNNIENQYFDVRNKDFIVWMRVAGLPTFRKLYAQVTDVGGAGASLPAGSYRIRVNNRYSTDRFGSGTKSIVLSSTSFIGGKNAFMGIAYIVVGGICLALALTFFLINLIRPRQLGDPALLSWNKNSSPQ